MLREKTGGALKLHKNLDFEAQLLQIEAKHYENLWFTYGRREKN